MSYTGINGMRSARYPLQGLGCCSACTGMGDLSFPEGAVLLLAAGGLLAGIGAALRPKVQANRRRRRHRR